MRLLRRTILVLAALLCLESFGAEQTFYRDFLGVIATNTQAWELRTPVLVDTNNNGYKLTNAILHLAAIKATGTLAGVAPGMTMDEVVTRWGKPMEVWIKGFGGPRLRYREVNVFFEPNSNRVKSLFTQDLPSLMRTLEITPKIQECLTALGEPSFRDDLPKGGEGFLVYEIEKVRLKLGTVRGKLSSIQLETRD